MTPKKHIIPVFVPHLGCPNSCVFCNQRKISGRLSPACGDDVRRAIANYTAVNPKGEAAELAFYGGSFTAVSNHAQKELLEAAAPYLEGGCISSIRVSTRPDAIERTVLDFLSEYGVKTIELGAQSMDDEVLVLSKRGHLSDDTKAAARLIKSMDFSLIMQMMTGLPGDTRDKSLNTARLIAELKPDGVRIYPTVIIKETELFEMWKCGTYSEHTVEEAVSLCADIYTIFEDAHIPVIRLGLNPTDDLSGGDAAGGAYHPAFGELVYSHVLLDKASNLISQLSLRDSIILGVSPSCVSKMTGQKRCNIDLLKERFSLRELKIKITDVPEGTVTIL